MKTFMLFTLVAVALLTSPLTAVIHQVRTGDNLQAKIDAAVTGDTVYVIDGLYNGDLLIDGKAIRLMAKDTNHQINGKVTIQNVSSGNKVILKNLNIANDVICNSSSLNLIRCSVELNVKCLGVSDSGGNPLSLVVYQSTIKEKLTAMAAKSWIGYNTIRHVEVTGVTHIVGNKIEGRNSMSIGVHAHGENTRLSMFNNWITGQGGSISEDAFEQCIGVMVDTNGSAQIINNRIEAMNDSNQSGAEDFVGIGIYIKSCAKADIVSNFIISSSIKNSEPTPTTSKDIHAPLGNVRVAYNRASSFGGGCVHFASVHGGDTNVASSEWLSPAFAHRHPHGHFDHYGKNKGPIDPRYNDHDGTRNNIGASGGRNYVQQGDLEDKPIPLWIDTDPILVPKNGKITLKSLGVVGK